MKQCWIIRCKYLQVNKSLVADLRIKNLQCVLYLIQMKKKSANSYRKKESIVFSAGCCLLFLLLLFVVFW